MTHPSRTPPPRPPDWPHCGHDATSEDPVGCHGVHVPGHTACLAHVSDTDRDAYLATLSPGSDIDHRGTTFTAELLDRLLDALRDPVTGHPCFGAAGFDSAVFLSDAEFASVTFQRNAWFEAASFAGVARFETTTFKGTAGFGAATFESAAWFGTTTFEGTAGFGAATFESAAWFEATAFKDTARFEAATFRRTAGFRRVVFEDVAWFEESVFEGTAGFRETVFADDAWFEATGFRSGASFESTAFERDVCFEAAAFKGDADFTRTIFKNNARFRTAAFEGAARFEAATFQSGSVFEAAVIKGDAWFVDTVFERSAGFGPLVCAGRLVLSGAVFGGPANLSLTARRLECRRTRWSSTAELRLRYATVDLSHAVFEYPLTIAAEPDAFVLADGRTVEERALAHAPDAAVRIATLRGVDAAHLVLADVDLSGCLFTGTVHLDQLRLEGICAFDTAPPGTHRRRRLPVRFTGRRTLAEEHHWRAKRPDAVRGWNTAVLGAGHAGPAQLAPVYRALRKAFEDGKNEPGAADFYYGEMEMRRHDPGTPGAERALLAAYWAVSGYGLRAVRALGWLAAAMLVTVVLLMGFGIPQNSPKQEATGTVPPGGGRVTLTIGKADPQNPTGDRFTGERFEKALNVTLNSVVFRSSGQDLTTTGTYIEMTSRLVEPVLLGLAVLAVRNRVKR
ncbi:pentapeptide repeat-containing protein [Streptomyces nanhaiensis]|uniref:pentapeptide repeat-containing protein n=1 Tax=Streptomyces nanhaiensis TaxID=679319 RepID=UPI00399D0F8E